MIELDHQQADSLRRSIQQVGTNVLSEQTGLHPEILEQVANSTATTVSLSPALARHITEGLNSLGIDTPPLVDAYILAQERMTVAEGFYRAFLW